MKFNKNTTLAEILKKPGGEKVLLKHRLPCLSCPFAESEMEHLKLAEICKMYGINLEALLSDLNRVDKK